MIDSPYAHFVKPLLAARLHAAGLAVEYHRGKEDRLYYRDARGEEIEVLDLVGGFGAALLGHNHPRVLDTVQRFCSELRPVHAQASIRGRTGELGARLCALSEAELGMSTVCTFANSGTEAVEAAIKHAEIERRRRVDRLLDSMQLRAHEIRQGVRDASLQLSEELFAAAAKRFGLSKIRGLEELFAHVARANLNAFDGRPAFLAIEGAFHGKTSGSLTLTYRPEYKAPWRHIGPFSGFLAPGDTASLQNFTEGNTIAYLVFDNEDGQVVLREERFVNIAACFVEIIQGEGGVHEIDHGFLRVLREAASAGGYPLIIDEIQTGMGRTGRFFASQHTGVVGDYYLLSKALGGSFAKISALLVKAERYVEDFGYLHTSTFAEDDLSAEVALTTLEVIAEDGLVERCERAGDDLLKRLGALAARFPDQLREVRGRGLMIGIELCSQQDSSSPLLRVLSEQDLLGFIVSGYLLHEAKIRVAPTLSARATIRVEPSAYFASADADAFCRALEGLLQCLRDGDIYRLTRFIVDRVGEEAPLATSAVEASRSTARPGMARVGFLCHFLEPKDLASWDKKLAAFSPEDCEKFLDRTRGMLEPFIVGTTEMKSPLGNSVHATIIGIPFTPNQVIAAMRSGEGQWGLDLLEQGVEVARRLGCSVVGFGGYTSILSNNCREIVASDLALTSGNSLTAAAALDSAFLAAKRLGMERRVLGVVGAAGNIGRVLAEVAAEDVDAIVLVGRKRAGRRLAKTAALLYASVLREAQQGADRGLAGVVARSGVLARIDTEGSIDKVGARIFDALQSELGDDAPVRVCQDMSALRGCNMIITATNSASPVILPEHIAESHAVVISDVAVPLDVDPRVVSARPKALVLRGGMIKAPLEQSVDVDGMNLRPGEIYGCLGETLLMGLAGIGENFSFGALSPIRVRRIRELARLHGFSVEENPA